MKNRARVRASTELSRMSGSCSTSTSTKRSAVASWPKEPNRLKSSSWWNWRK